MEVMWGTLQEFEVPGPVLWVIWSMHDHSESFVRIILCIVSIFLVGVGLHQGCYLSPILFLFLIDRIFGCSQDQELVGPGGPYRLHLCFVQMWRGIQSKHI